MPPDHCNFLKKTKTKNRWAGKGCEDFERERNQNLWNLFSEFLKLRISQTSLELAIGSNCMPSVQFTYFFYVYLFLREREAERENPKQAPHCQHRE